MTRRHKHNDIIVHTTQYEYNIECELMNIERHSHEFFPMFWKLKPTEHMKVIKGKP